MRLNYACRSSTKVCAEVEIRGRRGRYTFGSGTSPRLGSIIESIVGVRAPYCERVDSAASSSGVSSLPGTIVGPDGPTAFSSSSDIRELLVELSLKRDASPHSCSSHARRKVLKAVRVN